MSKLAPIFSLASSELGPPSFVWAVWGFRASFWLLLLALLNLQASNLTRVRSTLIKRSAGGLGWEAESCWSGLRQEGGGLQGGLSVKEGEITQVR